VLAARWRRKPAQAADAASPPQLAIY